MYALYSHLLSAWRICDSAPSYTVFVTVYCWMNTICVRVCVCVLPYRRNMHILDKMKNCLDDYHLSLYSVLDFKWESKISHVCMSVLAKYCRFVLLFVLA